MIELIALKKVVVRVDDLSESERNNMRRAVTLVEEMSALHELSVGIFGICTVIVMFSMFVVLEETSLLRDMPFWKFFSWSLAFGLFIGWVAAFIAVNAAQPFQRRDGLELYRLGQTSKRVYCFIDECLEREPRFKRWMPGHVEASKFAA